MKYLLQAFALAIAISYNGCTPSGISDSSQSQNSLQSTLSIDSFSANPQVISLGQSSTLSWNISNANSASLDNGIGSVSASNGTLQVTPNQTTTYTLSAQGSSGTVTAQATVTVSQGQAQVPVINSFTLDTSQINWGQSANLSWNVSYATSIMITPTVAGVNPLSGTFKVSPLNTTNYTLIASSPAGSSMSQITLTVGPGPGGGNGAPGAPATPTTFRVDVSQGTTGQLFLSWDQMNGATYYNLQRSTDALNYSIVSACSGTGAKYGYSSSAIVICRDPGLTAGKVYYYQTQACNSSGCSAFTDAAVNIPVFSNCTNGPSGQIPDLSALKAPRSVGVVTNVIDPLVTFYPTEQEFFGYPTSGVAHRNLLVVDLPGSGGKCGSGGGFADVAKNLGYDYVCVNYPNVAQQDDICTGNPDCYGYVSQAKLNATGYCSVPGDSTHCGKDPQTKQPFYNSNAHDGINMRLVTILQYAVNNGYNKNGTDWSQYLNGTNPNWSKMVIGGFSQGGVMGAYVAYNYPVARVHMQSSPPVATQINFKGQYVPATWVSQMSNQTSLQNFYGLVSANDIHYQNGTYSAVWQVLGFTPVNNQSEQKLSSFYGINCNSGSPSHNFSTSFIQSKAGGHPDTLFEWNEDVFKFMLNQ